MALVRFITKKSTCNNLKIKKTYTSGQKKVDSFKKVLKL